MLRAWLLTYHNEFPHNFKVYTTILRYFVKTYIQTHAPYLLSVSFYKYIALNDFISTLTALQYMQIVVETGQSHHWLT